MHELLLFGQVPAAQHPQVLKILAGIAAMQPQTLVERHLILKPNKSPATTVQVGAKQGIQSSQKTPVHGDLFYVQLVGVIETNHGTNATAAVNLSGEDGHMEMFQNNEEENGAGIAQNDKHETSATTIVSEEAESRTSRHDQVLKAQSWSFEFRDLPEVPGRRPVTSRLMNSTNILVGDPVAFVEAFGPYTFTSEYILQGHRLIHNNIILYLHRVLLPPSSVTPRPLETLPPLSTLTSFDLSGGYILQASIRVADGTKPETMNIGINELKAFKETMKGVVEMGVGDRLALDTRVRP